MIAALILACRIVEGPMITGKDAGIDPSITIGATPVPGVRRILTPAEQKRFGISEPLCFERATHLLTSPDVETALPVRAGVRIQLEDYTRTPVPSGRLEFSPSGPDYTGLWRGRIVYDENHSFAIFAKVKLTAEQTWTEAIQPLVPGRAIQPEQLEVKTGRRPPFTPATEIAGKIPRRTIHPGEPILPNMLTIPREVERGDKVTVDVNVGDAHLSFDAIAETSAHTGESVLIKNPENGRRFQAKVECKGKVVITR
jgi:flagella basal body P-ring formation protein FlgA